MYIYKRNYVVHYIKVTKKQYDSCSKFKSPEVDKSGKFTWTAPKTPGVRAFLKFDSQCVLCLTFVLLCFFWLLCNGWRFQCIVWLFVQRWFLMIPLFDYAQWYSSLFVAQSSSTSQKFWFVCSVGDHCKVHRQKMSHFIFSKVGKELTNSITL